MSAAILTGIYSISGLAYMCIFPVMGFLHICGKCGLNEKDYDLVVLDGIFNSITYKYRNTTWYKIYLFYVLISAAKTLMTSLLTISALLELNENNNDITVPTEYWISVCGAYFVSVLVIVNRGFKMYKYYPHNIDNKILKYEQSLLPYLVLSDQTGIYVTVFADYANCLISIYVAGEDPSVSISYKMAISMVITLGFLLYGTYDRYSFLKVSRNIENIKLDSNMQQSYNLLCAAKEIFNNYKQTEENKSNSKNIMCLISGIIFFILMIFVFVTYYRCYVEYYNSDDHSFGGCQLDTDHLIGWFIFISITIPLCLFFVCMRLHCYCCSGCIVLISSITMITFGSICVNQNGDKYNGYCGPAGYSGGLSLIVCGILVLFCCGRINKQHQMRYYQQHQIQRLEDHQNDLL